VLVVKKCKACRKVFVAERREPFITCPRCRNPLPDTAGACTHWNKVSGNGEMIETYHGAEMRDRR
jgi:predicted amidophosphoribosyltransferase